MKEITLTQGKVALLDDEDYDRLSIFAWYAQKKGHRWYAARGIWTDKTTKRVYMHQFILEPKRGFTIDHRDLDGLNNQRTNIRYATRQQQQQNRFSFRGFSKFKGIYREREKWVARIGLGNKKKKFLGYFNTEKQAALAYNEAALENFGEFAALNEVSE